MSNFHSDYDQQRSAPATLLALGSQVLYLAHDLPAEGLHELWASDGTTAGTHMLRELCPSDSYCDLESWVSMGSFALIRISEGFHQDRIWRTDGTPAGTLPLTGSMRDSNSRDLVTAGPFVYFTICTDISCRFWSSDGTVAGTKPVDETDLTERYLGWYDGQPRLVAWHDDVYLLAIGPSTHHYYGLWRASRRGGHLDEIRSLPDSYDVTPSSLTLAGDRLLFFADNGGRELWTSDATAAGTVPLTNFPNRNAIPGECPRLTVLGGRAWFVADDGAHGWELWSSDGTAAGTQRATDFSSRNPFGEVDEYSGPALPDRQLAWLGGKLLFASVATSGSPRLWTTDGDPCSTAPLRACPGGCPLVDASIPMVTIGDRAAFFAWRGSRESNLWVTDGTGAGTFYLPVPVEPGSYGSVELVAAGGHWFVGGDSLWASDGTQAGTVRVVSQMDPDWRGLAAELAAVPGSVFLRAAKGKDRWGLWQTTGGAAREVFTPPLEPDNYVGLLLGNAGDRVIAGGDGTCWAADAEGMALLPAAATNEAGCTSDTWMALSGPRAFVIESWETTLQSETNFWSTDGTPQGTTAIALENASIWSNVVPLADGARALYVSTGGLWASDGTAAGTALQVPLSFMPYPLVAGDGVAYFVQQDDAARSARLWSSDGTSAGTGPIGPSWTAIAGDPVVLGGRVHLLAKETANAPLALWTVDPADGTALSLSLAELGALEPVALTAAAGRLWFAARTEPEAPRPWRLWVSDGTASGTKRLPASMTTLSWDGYPMPFDPLPITALGDAVYFVDSDAVHGRELWRSDGTAAGTSIVFDLAPGLADGAPRSNLVAWRGRLWFAADDGARGAELWSTGGRAPGTRRELDLDRGPASSRPWNLTVAGDDLFFLADDGINGVQLWAVD